MNNEFATALLKVAGALLAVLATALLSAARMLDPKALLRGPAGVRGSGQGRAGIAAFGHSAIVVKVKKDGGTGGGATSSANWTYSIALPTQDVNAFGLVFLASGLAPKIYPPRGYVGAWVQAGDNSYGLAIKIGLTGFEAWELLMVGEVPQTDAGSVAGRWKINP